MTYVLDVREDVLYGCNTYTKKEKFMSKFWKKVEKCKHKNLSKNYSPTIRCGSVGDLGCNAVEHHCLDCGVYISKCQCGWCNGLSGWSHRRWMNTFKTKERNVKRLRDLTKKHK